MKASPPHILLALRLLTLASISTFTNIASAQSGHAVFNFASSDPAGEGFNDQTPTSSLDPIIIGDNPGTTLGDLRENVLIEAGNRWSRVLLSDVVIEVDVDYQDFGGSNGGSITLAAAGAATFSRNFTNAPLRNTFYPIALANSLAGRDLNTNIPDINVSANSNSELSDSQSGVFTWYYGLDNNAPAGTIDFLNVMSHELGHGLGFSSIVNTTNGNFFNGDPDSYSRNIYDAALELTWDQMTAAQRIVSAQSDPNLTWNGPNVTGAVNGVSSYVSQGINVGATSSTFFAALQASFGGVIPTQGLNGELVLVDDGVGATADLVEPIQNGAEVSGNIALIERGGANFDFKVRSAEDAGATGAILYNNIANSALISPSAAGGTTTPPTIPVLFISLESANELRALMASSGTNNLPITMLESSVTLQPEDNNEPATVRRLRLFAPSPLQAGSSVSHWSTSARPNLLMEPSINSNLTDDLDLSVLLMKDIGWQTANIGIPHLTYDTWLAETGFGTELTNTAQLDDFDQDGLSNIEEYYFGSDPRLANGSTLAITNQAITHQRSKLPNDLILSYQRSFLLESFTDFATTETMSDVTFSDEEVSIDIDTTNTREFYRLSLEALDSP